MTDLSKLLTMAAELASGPLRWAMTFLTPQFEASSKCCMASHHHNMAGNTMLDLGTSQSRAPSPLHRYPPSQRVSNPANLGRSKRLVRDRRRHQNLAHERIQHRLCPHPHYGWVHPVLARPPTLRPLARSSPAATSRSQISCGTSNARTAP
jgi:hypothetical protein